MRFNLNCKCGHNADLENLGNQQLTLKNIHQFYNKLICTKCRSKKSININLNEEQIIDHERLVLCKCNKPIIIPRLKINPNITTCITCQESSEKPIISPRIKIPRIPERFKKCSSGHKTVIQMNRESGKFFIGCSKFTDPSERCMWTKELPN